MYIAVLVKLNKVGDHNVFVEIAVFTCDSTT